MNSNPVSLRLLLCRCLPLLALAFAAAGVMAQADPPGRVAALSYMEGTVAFAPAGATEWADAAMNRPITRGDRLWTDPGARAELHLGSAALHMDSRTFLEVVALDDEVLQLSLNEGVVNARVRQLEGGENFEIATPQLAFRATQPGDYRIDADPESGTTRITMRSGAAIVQGAGGGSLQLHAGQQIAFTGRDLAPASANMPPVDEGFDRWAAGRNHSEDLSISARYVPREVVGYPQLDANGVWTQDPSYGAVWYPRVTVADWAPYRYGRWDWVAPWGWTWIDDAPWGFAPFHYGRWAQIGSRWAWVPGRIGKRPVYSPALVVFAGGHGGSGNWNLSTGWGPRIAWFPLAPGEAWRPAYRSSPNYLRNANRYYYAGSGNYFHQGRADAITAVRAEDFNRGRPVHRHWNRVNPNELAGLQIHAQPTLPEPKRGGDRGGAAQFSAQPQVQQAPAPAISARPQPQFQLFPGVVERREHEERTRPAFRWREGFDWQQRVQDEQRRQQIQRQAEQMQQDRARRDAQIQQLQQQAQRDLQAQQLHQAQRLQALQQQMQRQREGHERQQQSLREHGLRQQQAVQEQLQRQQQWQQQRAMPRHWQSLPQMVAPAVQAPPAAQHRGEGRERWQERGWRGQQRHERAARGEDEGGRGRGRGQRSFN